VIRTFAGKQPIFVAVISARRPHTVKEMSAFTKDTATWFVPEEDAAAYAEQGAVVYAGSANELCEARNAALEEATRQGAWCLQLSDDLKKVESPVWSVEKNKFVAEAMPFGTAVATMRQALLTTGASLAGVAPTANPFYYGGKPIHPKAFIVGDMMLIRTPSPCFDLELKLKEDYDFTLAHLKLNGMVARCNDILATFQHRSNKGGAVSYRTAQLEQESIAYLKQKWGSLIKDNTKRPNEILLNLR
jgi:hypothetical protein